MSGHWVAGLADQPTVSSAQSLSRRLLRITQVEIRVRVSLLYTPSSVLQSPIHHVESERRFYTLRSSHSKICVQFPRSASNERKLSHSKSDERAFFPLDSFRLRRLVQKLPNVQLSACRRFATTVTICDENKRDVTQTD